MVSSINIFPFAQNFLEKAGSAEDWQRFPPSKARRRLTGRRVFRIGTDAAPPANASGQA